MVKKLICGSVAMIMASNALAVDLSNCLSVTSKVKRLYTDGEMLIVVNENNQESIVANYDKCQLLRILNEEQVVKLAEAGAKFDVKESFDDGYKVEITQPLKGGNWGVWVARIVFNLISGGRTGDHDVCTYPDGSRNPDCDGSDDE